MEEKDLLRIAVHEAGHALLYEVYPESNSLIQVTIVPRGLALGLMCYLSEEEKRQITKKEFFCSLQALLGGRAAELIVFGEDQISTGASMDIMRSTNITRNMVMKWKEIGSDVDISPEERKEIDKEVQNILENALEKAVEKLGEYRKTLDALAEALLDKETLSGEEVRKIIRENKKTPQKTEQEREE